MALNNAFNKTICIHCKTATLESGAVNGDFSRGPFFLYGIRCGLRYSVKNNVIDTIPAETDGVRSVSQRVMESPFIVRIYENIFRPLVTRPSSDLRWEKKSAIDALELSPNHDVLDCACGTGNFTRLISRRVVDGTVVGTDLSMPMLRRAARNRSIDNE